MGAEVKVFLKCLSCKTFITSPSLPVIRKHFNKCQLKEEVNCHARHPAEFDDVKVLFDKDCDDFIDDEMETVAFTQPSVVLQRCNLERAKLSHLKADHPNGNFGPAINSDEMFVNKNGTKQKQCRLCKKFYTIKYLPFHKRMFHSSKDVSLKPETGTASYSCAYPHCAKTCKTVPLLRCHLILHLEKNPYVCNFPKCNVKCDAPCHLMQHVKLTHYAAPQTCAKCRVTYSRIKITNHNCEGNMSKVQSGGFKLVDIGGFWKLKRVETKHGSKNANLPLDPRFVSTPRLDKYDPNDKVNQYIESLKRIDINAIIRSDAGFIQACKDSPGFDKLILGYQYFGGKFRQFEKYNSRIYKCPKCPTIFTGNSGYQKHKKHCKGSEEVADKNVPPDVSQIQIGCQLCGKSFENDEFLEKHLSENHNSEKVFKCDEPDCGRYFNSCYLKTKHFQIVHMQRPFRCEKCKRRFISQSSFDQHMERHRLNPKFGDNKTPPCELCGKVLAGSNSRTRHMHTMHGVTSTLPIKKVQKANNDKKFGGVAEFPQNTEKVVKQVKIEPELTILPDDVKIESLDVQNYK